MTHTHLEKPVHTNRLIDEKSPYLLQHAHNPVNWYAWGDEPFETARLENKPIFLSIGYSTCHWCHVMEKESFENEAIAEILNTLFISIKVDREERPDIDQIYMIATQAMTGAGGWPMSVFLFPDKKPFYAGTYFPPEQRYNHPGFPDLLKSIAQAWAENMATLADSADKITTYLYKSSATKSKDDILRSWSDTGYKALIDSYDETYSGFGAGNKFPRPVSLDFLHRYGCRTDNTIALKMAEETLMAMAAGGMYDHIGGGFHRYAVDRQWRIPHFEKMLYDQAQLTVTYLHMYQQTGNERYALVAQDTLDYVLRDMQHTKGGLYSAEDADSINPYDEQEHSEGAFYLWHESEIRELLSEQDANIFTTCYGVKANGNALQDPAEEFTGRNILYMVCSLEDSAKKLHLSVDEVIASVNISQKRLLGRRNNRTRPHLDDKIITAWNGLMISALAKGGQILQMDSYLDEAKRVADFILENLVIDKELKRRWREGEARFDAVLEDYAFLVQGLLDLYSACHENRYLELAVEFTRKQVELFLDPMGGFFSSRESAGLLTRIKDSYDGAEPSGNSVSALNFLRLGRLLNNEEWIEIAQKTIKAFGSVLEEHGSAMPLMLTALELYFSPPKQLIISGNRDSAETEALLQPVNRRFLPNLQVLLADGGDNEKFLAQYLEIFSTTKKIDNRATAYLCENFVCQLPTNEVTELTELLKGNSSH